MSADAERRSRLLSVKLRALVRDHLGCDDAAVGSPHVFGPGAALVGDDAIWVLFDSQEQPSLGVALAWAERHRPGPDAVLHVLVERGSGVLSRRASLFDAPVVVWHVADRVLLPAVPEPRPGPRSVTDSHREFIDVIAAAGADPVVEHGVVTGEVRGLEICRVVDEPSTGAVRLEVGMGAHDREAFAMVHGEVPTAEALARVVAAVAPHRLDGADPHPFNRFGAERLLRWRACREPATVGCTLLVPADPPVPRTNVKDAVPCVAVGTSLDGEPVTAVFAHGVELDVVPFAVDAAAHHGTGSVIVSMRRKDVVAAIERMATASRTPVGFRFVTG